MGRLGETVRTVLRRAAAALRRNRLDDDLRDEVELHIELRRQALVDDGMDPRDAEYRGAADVRERRGNQRGDSGHVGISVGRNARAGPPLRRPSAPPLAHVHGGVGAVARDRHRCRGRCVQPRRCGAASQAAGEVPGRARRPAMVFRAQTAVRELVRARLQHRHAVHRARRSPSRPSRPCARKPPRTPTSSGSHSSPGSTCRATAARRLPAPSSSRATTSTCSACLRRPAGPWSRPTIVRARLPSR